MYELPDSEPLVRSRPFNSVTGASITVGSIQKLAAAADDNRAALAKMAAKLDADIAELERRLDVVEAETKARIAAVSTAETLAQRLARLNPRR